MHGLRRWGLLVMLAVGEVGAPVLGAGGNTPGSGPVITNADLVAPGYTDTGDTSAGYTNDGGGNLLPGCPNGPSTSPDAWYRLEITETVSVRVELCASAYDTKTYLTTPDGTAIACNDDACPGFRSILEVPDLAPGSYDLAVDGAYGASGAYSITVREPARGVCVLDPPCNGVSEGEVCPSWEDTTNGGCNSTPPVFGSITIDGPPICGTSWSPGGFRDTDWFAFSVSETVTVDVHVDAEGDMAAFIVAFPDGAGVCTNLSVAGEIATSLDCGVNTPGGADLDPGDYALVARLAPYKPCQIYECPCRAYQLSIVTRPPPPPPCPWDLTGDDGVGYADLLALLQHWGCCPGFVPNPAGGEPECVQEKE